MHTISVPEVVVRAWLVVAAIAASHVGCNDKGRAAWSPTVASSSTHDNSPPATPAASSVAAPHVGTPSSRLAQCPNAVEGATTVLRDVDQGIELRVTASDDAAIAEIRGRAGALVLAARDPALQEKHGSGTGGGGGGGSGGGGASGRCPVVMKRTAVDAHDVEKGSAIVVTARRADNVDWVRRETRERQDEILAPPK